MDFKKYQHIEKFGSDETAGINIGTCYIFPKIDGTNGSIWYNDGVRCGSRTREISVENDNFDFARYVDSNPKYEKFFRDFGDLRLYGEYLVPHALRTYYDNAWKTFYVFDVMDGETYLPYDVYSKVLQEYDIDFIPPIAIIKNPTYERLIGFLDKNTYLINDGMGVGEGIVIKNYAYYNRFGRKTWAKIVRNEFKALHAKVQPTEVKEKKLIEEDIVNKYVTVALVEKEFAKIEGWSSRMIPRLLNTVYYCLIKEESWDFIKEFKNPTINYKTLLYMCNNKVKEIKPELF